MKCSICGNKIEETFLNKIVGTFILDKKDKHAVCPGCQKKYISIEELKRNIK